MSLLPVVPQQGGSIDHGGRRGGDEPSLELRPHAAGRRTQGSQVTVPFPALHLQARQRGYGGPVDRIVLGGPLVRVGEQADRLAKRRLVARVAREQPQPPGQANR